jgi:hypothetical protein
VKRVERGDALEEVFFAKADVIVDEHLITLFHIMQGLQCAILFESQIGFLGMVQINGHVKGIETNTRYAD